MSTRLSQNIKMQVLYLPMNPLFPNLKDEDELIRCACIIFVLFWHVWFRTYISYMTVVWITSSNLIGIFVANILCFLTQMKCKIHLLLSRLSHHIQLFALPIQLCYLSLHLVMITYPSLVCQQVSQPGLNTSRI